MQSKHFRALGLLYALTQALFPLQSSAQLPRCDRIYMNVIHSAPPAKISDSLFMYDPGQPVSATNPSLNSIRLPDNNLGLAICPVLGSTNNTPTFYMAVWVGTNQQTYYYYDPATSAWVNTGHSCGPSNYVNFAAGGGYIYSMTGVGGFPGVCRYDGTGDAVYLVHVISPLPYDLVADCQGNFYIITLLGPMYSMTKYSPAGTILQGYTVNNPSNYRFSGGLGIIGNDIYADDYSNKGIAHGVLTGSILNFTNESAPVPLLQAGYDVGDFGSCAQMMNTLPTLTIAATDTLVCAGTAVTFTSSNTNAGNNPQYQWLKNGIAIPGATGNSLTYTPADSDMITLQMTGNDPCSGMTVTTPAITLHVQSSSSALPTLTITATDTVICAGVSVTFTAASTNAGSNPKYQWFKNGVAIPGAIIGSLIGTPDDNDVFTLQLMDSGGCSSVTVTSAAVTMHVQTRPSLQIVPGDNSICLGDSIQLAVTTDSSCQVQWLPGNDYQVGSTTGNKAFIIPSGNCMVTVKAIGANGCDTSVTIPVSVMSNCCVVNIPDAFTPNGDGRNDVFRPRGNGYQTISFLIYNRFGQLVFASHQNNDGWNGMLNGVKQDAGAFVYLLQYRCSNSDKIMMQKGTVLLVK